MHLMKKATVSEAFLCEHCEKNYCENPKKRAKLHWAFSKDGEIFAFNFLSLERQIHISVGFNQTRFFSLSDWKNPDEVKFDFIFSPPTSETEFEELWKRRKTWGTWK